MARGKAFTTKPLLNLASSVSRLDPVLLAFRLSFDILYPILHRAMKPSKPLLSGRGFE